MSVCGPRQRAPACAIDSNGSMYRVSGLPSATSNMLEAHDVDALATVLELAVSPLWIYDFRSGRNIWGNSAALGLCGTDVTAFKACQFEHAAALSQPQHSIWNELNELAQQRVEVEATEFTISNITRELPAPGFLPCLNASCGDSMEALYKPLKILVEGRERVVALVQVMKQFTPVSGLGDGSEERHLRMVDMCNNHSMFQFLFDENGKMLVANKRGLQNMIAHLGQRDSYMLQAYLELGESGEGVDPHQMCREALTAIFVDNKPCHRFSQYRHSKRHPGKYRWVLFEMWPLTDPVTHTKAALVVAQNITQVKELEEHFRKQNEHLKAQLEEALAQRDPMHKPAIDIDTPADKTLKMLEKIMRGQEVDAREVLELRHAITRAGGDLRQPVNLNEQLLQQGGSTLDLEVGESLIQLLSSRPACKVGDDSRPASTEDVNHHASRRVTPSSIINLLESKTMPDAVMAVLCKVDDWQFDAFKLCEVSSGRPLSMLSYFLFQRYEMVTKLQLDVNKLVKFLMKVEEGYPNNPYHNRIHAADVLQGMHVLLCRGGIMQAAVVDDTDVLACYLSAIVHDYEHKGVNNDFLVRVSDSLAILYNDRSPMENHHLAAAFQLANSTEYNFMPHLPQKARESLRKLVIEMVLATDMKQHFAIHSMFQSKLQLSGSGGNKQRGPSPQGGRSPHSSTSPHSSEGQSSRGALRVFDEDMTGLALQVALKCADLGHLACPRAVHKRWVMQLEEEFFRQGDREKMCCLSVSPLMDRTKNGITKSQVGFFDIVVLPLFQSFTLAFPDTLPLLDAVKDNYAMWREEALALH